MSEDDDLIALVRKEIENWMIDDLIVSITEMINREHGWTTEGVNEPMTVNYKRGAPMRTVREIYSGEMPGGIILPEFRVVLKQHESGEFTANTALPGFDGTFYCMSGTYWVKLEWLEPEEHHD